MSRFLFCFNVLCSSEEGASERKDSNLVHSHDFIDHKIKAKVIYLIVNPRSPLYLCVLPFFCFLHF